MNFGKLTNSKKKAIADEVYEWYEKKYQIEVPDQEKQEFYHEACFDPSGWQLLERFHRAYLDCKAIDVDTIQLQQEVESKQVELERLKSKNDELTTLELDINESENTFCCSSGLESLDVDSQRNNLKLVIKQSAIDQKIPKDDFVNEAETNCNEIGSLTEHMLNEVNQARLDIENKSPFHLENFAQNDEIALQITKKCSDSLKIADFNRKMLKHRVAMLERFISSLWESRSQIKGAVAYYSTNPERLKNQVRKCRYEVTVLREQHQMKIENLIDVLKKADNTEFTDTILKIFARQLENEITLLENFSTELDYFQKLHDLTMTALEIFVDIIRSPHVMNSFRSSLIRDLAGLTEKLNSTIKKELRRRSDIENLRDFVDDDDEIGHLLAKHYDLENYQNSIVPVVQKKRICAHVQEDISTKNETKLKILQEQTAMLNINISNIHKNLSEIPVTTDRLEKLVNFDCEKRLDDTTMKSRLTPRTTLSSTTLASDRTDVSFLEKSRFEMNEFCYQIEMLLEKWDKEKSNQGLNLHLATQQFSFEIANKDKNAE